MPKHKRNAFSWITREVKTVCSWNLTSLFYITKEKKIIKIFFKKLTWKPVQGPFVIAKNEAQPLLKNETFEPSYLY